MVGEIDTVTVGQIERPFGVKGEVKVRSLTDVPGRFQALTDVSLVAKSGKTMDTSVTGVRRAGEGFVVRFAGIATPEDARLWRGGLIQVTRGTVPQLPAGQYYECDLLGLAVQSEQGRPIGVLEEIWELPGNHLFVIRQGEKEILIPAAKEWVTHVDLEQRRMTVHMIDGMDE